MMDVKRSDLQRLNVRVEAELYKCNLQKRVVNRIHFSGWINRTGKPTFRIGQMQN